MTAAPDEIGVYLPLIVAVAVTLATIVIHALAFIVTIHYVLRKQKLGQAARRFLRDVAIVAVATFIMLAAHLVEIAVWALVFVAIGEFPALASAFYHSAVNYTSLGLDNVFMSPAWRMLSPLEAADGMLMFGVSTAMLFAIAQRLVHVRLLDSEPNS